MQRQCPILYLGILRYDAKFNQSHRRVFIQQRTHVKSAAGILQAANVGGHLTDLTCEMALTGKMFTALPIRHAKFVAGLAAIPFGEGEMITE